MFLRGWQAVHRMTPSSASRLTPAEVYLYRNEGYCLPAAPVTLWRRIVDARRADGSASNVVTPEFGPPPYMPCEPFTERPLADAWAVNALIS